MLNKTISGILFALLLTGMLTLAFNIQPVKSTWTGGTIYIRADGSIDPPDAPIITYDNITYTLTDNINSSANGIVIERDNIVLDGAGYTVKGAGVYESKGIRVPGRSNVIINNTKIKNFYYGIVLGYSSNATITGSNVTNNKNGLVFYHSSNNTVVGNIFVNDGLYVLFSYDNVVVDNLVNGKPLVYLENVSGYSVGDAGQVILVNCNNILVENLNLSNTDIGVELWRTNNTIVKGNNIRANNEDGVGLGYSSHNIITENNITNNEDGICLHGSFTQIATENNITLNNIAKNWNGIKLYASSYNRISGNKLTSNRFGVWLNCSSNNSLSENNITNNGDGLDLYESDNNSIVGNNITANNLGVFLYSNNTSIVGNHIANKGDGIDLYGFNNSIVENEIMDTGCPIEIWPSSSISIIRNNMENNLYGIWTRGVIGPSSNINIVGNNITNTRKYGIFLYESSNNSIIENNIVNSSLSGIWLDDSPKSFIARNNITGNGRGSTTRNQGVWLSSSPNSSLIGNNIVNNPVGIQLSSSNCKVTGNNVINNDEGIYLQCASNNSIAGNNIEDNEYGIHFYGYIIHDGLWIICLSNNNSVVENNIKNNTYGIKLFNASYNKFYHNNFINNTVQVDSENSTNLWDDGYPSGGNYWSDYTGVDLYSGPHQNETGSDGIGDTPYIFNENNVDHYPLIASFEAFNVGVWNGVSYGVDVVSNSTVSNLKFNPYEWRPRVEFNVTGVNGTAGFCRVTIPKTLLWAKENQWIVFVGGEKVNYTSYLDEENTYLYFTYTHSTKKVLIQGTETIIPFYNLTITSTEGGTTNPTPGTYTYANGTEVTVTAIPNTGFSFNYWLLDNEKRTENPIMIVMTSNHTLEAYFIDDIPPELSDPWQEPSPDNVQPFQNVTVWVNATDYGSGIKNVTLWYRLDNETKWTELNMTALPIPSDAIITYEATIPGFENGTWITYKIIAYDNAGNNAAKDNNGYNYKYHIIPEFPQVAILIPLLIATLITTIILKKNRKPKFQQPS